MDDFVYKKKVGIISLAAKMSEFSYKKHSHEEYLIGVTLQGIQEYHLGRSLQHSYESGVMLFNPDDVHDGRAGNHHIGLDYVMLYIKPKIVLESLEKKEMVKFSSPIIYNLEIAHKIVALASAILGDADEVLCNELLTEIMDRLSAENLYKQCRVDSAFIKKSKEIIYYATDSVLSLEDICAEFGMSKFKFIRIFKKVTGLSPYQYFLNVKLSQAKNHLEKYRDLYATIADFNFTDLSHLNRHFKKVYGVTAYEYLLSI